MSPQKRALILTTLVLLTLLIPTATAAANLSYDSYLPLVIQGADPTPTPSPTQPGAPTVEITYIEFNPPGDDLLGEYVQITNHGDTTVNLTYWYIKDAANHMYSFSSGTAIPPGGSIRLWTGTGVNTATDIYWNSNLPIWNNDHDTAYLKNSAGVLVDEYSY